MTDSTEGSGFEDTPIEAELLEVPEQNPALPDQGSSDGNDEDVADQVPGPQG